MLEALLDEDDSDDEAHLRGDEVFGGAEAASHIALDPEAGLLRLLGEMQGGGHPWIRGPRAGGDGDGAAKERGLGGGPAGVNGATRALRPNATRAGARDGREGDERFPRGAPQPPSGRVARQPRPGLRRVRGFPARAASHRDETEASTPPSERARLPSAAASSSARARSRGNRSLENTGIAVSRGGGFRGRRGRRARSRRARRRRREKPSDPRATPPRPSRTPRRSCASPAVIRAQARRAVWRAQASSANSPK